MIDITKIFNRKALIAIGILCLLFLIAAAAVVLNLGRLVDSNKEVLLAQAEKALGRKPSVEKIDVTLWSGIGVRLTNFSLADDPKFSVKDFIKTPSVLIDLQLWPLLFKREIAVGRFILQDPVIEIVRDQKGQWNAASLGKPEEASKTGGVPSPASVDSAPKSTERLMLSNFQVRNGELRFVDKQGGKELRVSQCDLSVTNFFSTLQPYNFHLSAAILSDKRNLDVQGEGNKDKSAESAFSVYPVEGRLKIDSLPMDKIVNALPFLMDYLPDGLELSGSMQANAKFQMYEKNISLPEIDFQSGLFGSAKPNFLFKGKIEKLTSVKDININGDAQFDSIDAGKLLKMPLLSKSLPAEWKAEGSLSGLAHFEGNSGNLKFHGEIDGTECEMAYADYYRKPKGTAFRWIADARLAETPVAIDKTNLRIDKTEITGSGKIPRDKNGALEFSLSMPSAKLDNIKRISPLLAKYDPVGSLAAQLEIKRKGDALSLQGTLGLKQVQAKVPSLTKPISNLNAQVLLNGDKAEVKECSFNIGRSAVNLSAQAEKINPPALTFRVSAPEFYLDDLRQNAEASAKPDMLNDAVCDGRFWSDKGGYAAKGNLVSPKGRFSGMDYSNLKGDFNLAKRVLTIGNLAAETLSGALKGKAEYDFNASPPRFAIGAQAEKLNIAEYFTGAGSSLPKSMEGRLNFNLGLEGNGAEWKAIQSTLKGNGEIEILDGVILDANIADGVLKGMTGMPGLTNFIAPDLQAKFPSVFASRNTLFNALQAIFTVSDGKIQFSDLVISATDWTVNGGGWMNFDRLVDSTGVLNLSKGFSDNLIQKASLFRYLADEKNRIAIPFALSGAFPNIKPAPDASLAQILQNALLGKGLEQLQKKGLPNLAPLFNLKQKASPAAATGELEAATPAKTAPFNPFDLLQGVLNKPKK
ncbi:MAG: AsmA family protein [Candidatus Omnitrophota bacterium]